jgi:hypothetical protein
MKVDQSTFEAIVSLEFIGEETIFYVIETLSDDKTTILHFV